MKRVYISRNVEEVLGSNLYQMSTDSPAIGQWVRVTACMDTENPSVLHIVFYNMNQENAASEAYTTRQGMSGNFLVGYKGVKMTVDEIILWDTELTQVQVQALYNGDPEDEN